MTGKRLLVRIELFKTGIFDFKDVDSTGQIVSPIDNLSIFL